MTELKDEESVTEMGEEQAVNVPEDKKAIESCYDSPVWPANRERVQNVIKTRTEAKRGQCWKEGPTFEFSLRWLFTTYAGLVYFQTYLWFFKDWAWSQLRWFWPGILFGSLAIVSGTILVLGAIYFKAYSEAAVAFGLLIWLYGNYWWMVGEIWGYYIDEDTPDFFYPEVFDEEGGTDEFYEQHTDHAKYIIMTAVIWLFCVLFILPFFYFDRDSKFMTDVTDHCPRFRFRFFCRDFLEYENFHVFFWAVKDMFWAFENPVGFFIFFVCTMSLLSDTIYLVATTEGHFVDLVHYIAIFLWVLANGFWAAGELLVEDVSDVPDEAYNNYTFVPTKDFNFFWGRNIAGWLYFLAVIIVAVFYMYWLLFFKIESVEEVEKDEEEKEKPKVEE